MLSYPHVVMPDAFTYLLRSNMQSSGKLFMQLQLYVVQHPDLELLVARCFKTIDSELRVEAIIKSLGWHGFRDHLGALYIERARLGHYPQQLDAGAVSEIMRFEERLKDYTVQGYSRAFLLAFYQKLMLLSASQKAPSTKFHNLLIHDDIISYLELARGRSVKIDFVLLILQHLDQFLGARTLRKYLADQKSYEEMYRRLEGPQRYLLMQNLLAYAASIGESEVFLTGGV